MINEQHSSSVVNEHFKLKTLQNAPRDADDKLERLLQVKEKQKEQAMDMEDTQQRSVIERLKC